MATFVKTKKGWKAVIRKTGWPTSAKTFRVKRDAEDWARRAEDEMVRGVYVVRAPSEKLTLKAAMDRYLKEVTPKKAETTQGPERRRAETLKKELGAYSLAALTLNPQIVAEYRDRRLNTVSRYGRSMSSDTVRLEIALLGNLFTVAIKEWGLGLPANPVEMIRRPPPGPGRDRRLEPEEEDRLLAAAKSYSQPMVFWIIALAVETSMRKGEILGLVRSQVDIEKRVIHLPLTKNKEARDVPLTKKAVEVMRRALENPLRPEGTDLVFFGEPGRDGVRRPYHFDSAWQKIRERAGLPDVRVHDLRHEAISRFVEAGLSDLEVAQISGHKAMQMLKRYAHLRAKKLVSRLDDTMGANGK